MAVSNHVWIGEEPRYYYKKVQQPSKAFALAVATITDIAYVQDGASTAESASPLSVWHVQADVPEGLELQTDGVVFTLAGTNYFSRAGILFKGWDFSTGVTTQVGTVLSNGLITIDASAFSTSTGLNSLSFSNIAYNYEASLDIFGGVFRVNVAPIKGGSFQLQDGPNIGSANSGGILSGDFEGTVDFARGIVRWKVAGLGPGDAEGEPAQADQITYNAVYLQYIPLDENLLGLNTVRLPLDGKVPVFRKGDLGVVHNTQEFTFPSTLTADFAYDMGRVRIAHVKVLDALGVVVPSTLYTTDLDAGLITFPGSSVLTPYTQPFVAKHRIEDLLLMGEVDISGKVTFTRSLSHNFPAASSYLSSALVNGDLFARAENYFEQANWASVWDDEPAGSPISPQFNNTLYPAVVTNRGAITERWALVFTSSTEFRIIGEFSGQVGTGTISTTTEPNNPPVSVPYFTINPLAFGSGWANGNVVRFNTFACGAPLHVVRTILQGPYTALSDKFEIAYRGNVNA